MTGFISKLQDKLAQLMTVSPGEAPGFAQYMACTERAIESTGEPVYQGADGNLYAAGGQVSTGGSSTLAGLSDVTSYDLADNNTSVAAIKAAQTVQAISGQTGTTYTLALSDAGQNVDMNNAAANTLTIPANASVALPVGTVITITQAGAGQTTIAAAGGVTTIKPAARSYIISAQYETAMLHKVGTDTWRVYCN